MIQREIYLKQLIQAKDNGLPNVVTGIRRCGKSTLLKDLYISWLKENGVPEDHILFLSLDKDENAECLDPPLFWGSVSAHGAEVRIVAMCS